MIKALLIISTTIIIGLTGCATITDIEARMWEKDGVWHFEGPKDVSMEVTGKAKYDGKKKSTWDKLLEIMMIKTVPNVEVSK